LFFEENRCAENKTDKMNIRREWKKRAGKKKEKQKEETERKIIA
jgi:hypothetical protein